MEELKRTEELRGWIDHVISMLQSGLAVEEVFTLTILELQVPYRDLGFLSFDIFLDQIPNLGTVLKDPKSILQTRTVTPVALVPAGPSEEGCLKIANRVIYFGSDSTPKKGTIRWLGRVEKIMCAGVECAEKIGSPRYIIWKEQELFHTASPGHSRMFRIHELMLKADFEARPTSKITKALTKAMTKIGIKDTPVADVRVHGGIGNTAVPVIRPSSDPASFDVIYPFSVDYSPNGLTINDLVVWLSDRGPFTGIVMWLGHLNHSSGLVAGIDFQQSVGTTNGIAGNQQLFHCLPNHGMFIAVSGLIKYDDFNQTTGPTINLINRNMAVTALSSVTGNSEKDASKVFTADPNVPVEDLLGIEQISPAITIGDSVNYNKAEDSEIDLFTDSVSNAKSNSPGTTTISAQTPERNISPELLDTYIEPYITQSRLDRLIGVPKGIQGRNNSCYIDSTLFALFACSDTFDEILLKDDEYETILGRKLKLIMRLHIANQLRRNYYCPADHVDRLRISLGELDRKYLSAMGDCEEFLHTLLDKVLRLKQFIYYTNGVHDFMHQLLPNSLMTAEFGTMQSLLENSMHFQGLKFQTVPEPALLLLLPRVNGQLVQHKRVIPNLTLHLAPMLNISRACGICNDPVATMECAECCNAISPSTGMKTCAFCGPCFKAFHQHMSRVYHMSSAAPIREPSPESMELHLQAIICLVNTNHFISYVKCGQETLDPWIQHDSMFEGLTPKVQAIFGVGECLAELEKTPSSASADWDLFIPEIKNILSNSHLLIYSARNQNLELIQTTSV